MESQMSCIIYHWLSRISRQNLKLEEFSNLMHFAFRILTWFYQSWISVRVNLIKNISCLLYTTAIHTIRVKYIVTWCCWICVSELNWIWKLFVTNSPLEVVQTTLYSDNTLWIVKVTLDYNTIFVQKYSNFPKGVYQCRIIKCWFSKE